MDQNKEKQLRLLYSIQQETQSGEIIDKIIWNEQITNQILPLLQDEQKVQVVGLFGTLETIKEYLEIRESCILQIDEEVKSNKDRGKLCMLFEQQIYYLAFITSEEYLTKDLFIKSEEITVYRFLRDLTQSIILLPSQKVLEGWKVENLQCNQNQSNKVSQFEIRELEDTQLEVKQIKLKLDSKFRQAIKNSLQSQNNIRCFQLRTDQQDIIDINHLFDSLVRQIGTNENQIQFPQLSLKDQEAIRIISKDYKYIIDEHFRKIFQQLKQIVIDKQLNKFYNKNKLQDDQIFFKQLHKYLKNPLRLQMNIFGKNNNIDLVKEIKDKFKSYKNSTDLIQVVQTYIEEFKILETKHNATINNIYNQFCKQIQTKIQDNLYLRMQFFEFKHFTHKDLSQNLECLIEQPINQQINIQDVIGKQQTSHSYYVQYYFKLSNQQNMLILKSFSDASNYWISYQQSNIQLITKFNSNYDETLLYHYEESNTTLYVFNTKIGISSIFYNETIKKKGQERNIQTNSTFNNFCYLKYFTCFILIDQNYKLWKWKIQNQKLESLNIDINSFKPTQNQQRNYQKVMSAGQGNYFCLSNSQKCDIYNFNNQIVIQIIYNQYNITCYDAQNILLFSSQRDWFIILFDAKDHNKQIAIQIQNINNQSQLIENTEEEKKISFSNPFLDIVQASIDKYGPNLNIQKSQKMQTKLYASQDIYNKIEKYFNLLELNQSDELSYSEDIYQIQGYTTINKIFSFNLITRIPIQLCSMDQQYLVPLSNGLKIQESNLEEASIHQYVEQIKFGILEQLLNQHQQNVFIVSIIGKQSSGKSYLLNRTFGTRFSVSSARCTDGIWMSVGQLENQLFIIFDCEGLFSTQRTSDEEIKLLSFLVSLSDITILNQDLTFNRNFNDLFKNLQETVKYIKGEKLFKGKLMIVVRDVNRKEQDEAMIELKKSITLITEGTQNSFIKQLFNGKIITKLMSNFEVTNSFENDIKEIRQVFLDNSSNYERWQVQQNIIGIMKILLVQLNVTDNCTLEEHEYQMKFKSIKKKILDLWKKFQQQSLQKLQFEESATTYNELMKITQYGDISKNQKTIDHNNLLQLKQQIFKNLLEARIDQILNSVDQELEDMTSSGKQKDEDKKLKERQKLQQELIQKSMYYQICQEKCSICYLNCTQSKNHIENDSLTQKNKLLDQIRIIIEKLDELNQQKNQLDDNKTELMQVEDQLIHYSKNLHGINRMIEYCTSLNIKQNLEAQMIQLFNQNCQNIDEFKHYIRNMLIRSYPQEQLMNENLQEEIQQIYNKINYEYNKISKEQQSFQETQSKYKEQIDQNINNNIEQQLVLIDQDISHVDQQIAQNNIEKFELQENYQMIIQKINKSDDCQYKNSIDQYQKKFNLFQKERQDKLKYQQEKQLELNQEILEFNCLQEYLEAKEQQSTDDISENTYKLSVVLKNIDQKKKVGQSKLKQKSQSKDTTTFVDLEKQKLEIEYDIQLDQKIIDFIQSIRYQDDHQIQQEQIEQGEANLKQDVTNMEQEQNGDQYKNIKKQHCQENQDDGETQEQIRDDQQQQDVLDVQENQDDVEIQEKVKDDQQQDQAIDKNQLNVINPKIQINYTNQEIVSALFNIQNPNFECELNKIQQQISDAEVAIEYCQSLNLSVQIKQKIQESDQLDQEYLTKLSDLKQQKSMKSELQKQYYEQNQKLHKDIIQIEEHLDKLQEKYKIIKQDHILINEIKDQYEAVIKLENKINAINEKIYSYNEDQIHKNHEIDALNKQKLDIEKEINSLDEKKSYLQNLIKLEQEKQSIEKELDELEKSISSKHNCGRQSHQCDQFCQSCTQEHIACKDLAGHQTDVHLCQNNEHFCKQQCSIQNCQNVCQQFFMHDEKIRHLCNENHPCKEKCQYSNCQNDCVISASQIHQDHKCQIKKCTRLCYFGENYFRENLKCNGKCSLDHTENHELHICDHERHQCNMACELEGVCKIETYTEIYKTKQSKDGLTTYTYKFIKQNQKKTQCQIFLAKGQINHDKQHTCGIQQHQCEERCPECEAFCTENYKHEGFHKTIHRNKDSQLITYKEGDQIQSEQNQFDDQSTLQFEVGETNEAETCSNSCKRKSRAHFHLIECKNKNQCLSHDINRKANRVVAKHQTKNYIGSNKQYDEVLCQYYWEYQQWETPYHDQQNYINQCNYYCNICENKDKFYCNSEAWHSESSDYKDHNFVCADLHKDIDGVDVQFVIDTTGSMEKHIQLVKTTIKNLITAANKYLNQDKKCVQFSIISYKDHLDVVNINTLLNQDVCQFKDFSDPNDAIKFLDTLKAEGGGDFPEAMLDGLDKGSSMQWRDKTKKFLFLIAESPPHGSPKFHNFDDDFPHGCPCGRNEITILNCLKDKNIKILFYMLNDSLNQTYEIFKQIMPNIEELKGITEQFFMAKLQLMVCQQLKIRDVTIRKE